MVYRDYYGDIYEVYSRGGDWSIANLSLPNFFRTYRAPRAWSTPVAYVRSDGINCVVYVGTDRHIYELSQFGDWQLKDLSLESGALASSVWAGPGTPAAYVRYDGTNSVVYVATDGHIHELTKGWGASAWYSWDLTVVTRAPSPQGTTVSAYVRSDGVSSVVYQGFDHHIHELGMSKSGLWQHGDVSYNAGASNEARPAADGHPVGYRSAGGYNSVVYRGENGQIYELLLSGDVSLSSRRWQFGDISGLAVAHTAVGGIAAYVRSDGMNSVVYKDAGGHICELSLVRGRWLFTDLSGTAGGSPLAR